MPRRSELKVVSRPSTTTLYLRGTVRGQRVFESTGTSDPKLAEEARAIREAELYRSAVLGTKPRVALAQAALSYLEHEARSQKTEILVGRLVKHFGPTLTCDQVDQARIDKACSALLRPGAKPATKLRLVITPAKAVLSHAARRGWCDPPRFEQVKGGGKRTDWLTPDEAEALIDAAPGHLKPLLVFLFCTGARLGEALALEWQDVQLQHARAVLRDTKNGDDRIVELPAYAVAALANLPHRNGRVFLSPRGPYRLTDDTRHGASGGQIKRGWASALRKAGITKRVTPHHCRHTWATWHYAIYRDLLKLRDDGGWRSSSQTERYAKLAPDALRPAILAFWGNGAIAAQTPANDSAVA